MDLCIKALLFTLGFERWSLGVQYGHDGFLCVISYFKKETSTMHCTEQLSCEYIQTNANHLLPHNAYNAR